MLLFFSAQKGDHGKIVDITVDPNPPKIGSDVSIIANITVGKTGIRTVIQHFFFTNITVGKTGIRTVIQHFFFTAYSVIQGQGL